MSHLYNNKSTETYRRNLRKNTTPQEGMLWANIKDKKLGFKFRRQFAIGNYVADFFCSEKKLVIEIDGSQHFEKDAVEYDKIRSKFLEVQGCKVLRFSNDQINTNMEGVIMKIREVLNGL